MVEIKKCLDTYSLVEVAKGNSKFADYLNSDFVIADITLAEFYAIILREYDENTADYWYKKLESNSCSADLSILIEGVKFRYKNRKSNVSFFDAVGYIFSLKNGCLFVTGDKEFESFKGVEFSKK